MNNNQVSRQSPRNNSWNPRVKIPSRQLARRPDEPNPQPAPAPKPRPRNRNLVGRDDLANKAAIAWERLQRSLPIGTPLGSAIPQSQTPAAKNIFLLGSRFGVDSYSVFIPGRGEGLLLRINMQNGGSGHSRLRINAEAAQTSDTNNAEYRHRTQAEHLSDAQQAGTFVAQINGPHFLQYGAPPLGLNTSGTSFAFWQNGNVLGFGIEEPGPKALFRVDNQGRASIVKSTLNTGAANSDGSRNVESPDEIKRSMRGYPTGFVGLALTDRLRGERETGITMVGVDAQGRMIAFNTRTPMTYGEAEQIVRRGGAVGEVLLLDSGNSSFSATETPQGVVTVVSGNNRPVPVTLDILGVAQASEQITPAPAKKPSSPNPPASPPSNAPAFIRKPENTEMPPVTYGREGDLIRKLIPTKENRESTFIYGTVALSSAMAQDRDFYVKIRTLQPGETYQAPALLGPGNVPATITVTGAPYNASNPNGVIGVTVESKFGKVTMYVSVTNVQDPPLNILGYTNALIRSRGGSSGSPPVTNRPATPTPEQQRLGILRNASLLDQENFFNALPKMQRRSVIGANDDLRNGTTPDAGGDTRTGQQAWRDLIKKGTPIGYDDNTVIIGPAGRAGYVRVAVRVDNKWICTDYSVVPQTSKNKEDGAINIWQNGKGFGTAPSLQSSGVARTGKKPLPPPSEVTNGQTYKTAEVVPNQEVFARDMPSSVKTGLIKLNNRLKNSDEVMRPEDGELTYKQAWVFLRAGKPYSWNYEGTDSRGRKFRGQVVIERNTAAPETYWVAYSDANGKWRKASFSANAAKSNPANGAINLWPAFGTAPGSR
jgi:hypothetical protein